MYLDLLVSNSSRSRLRNRACSSSISSLDGVAFFVQSIGSPITRVIGWRRGIRPKLCWNSPRPLNRTGASVVCFLIISWIFRTADPFSFWVVSYTFVSPNAMAGTSAAPFCIARRTIPLRVFKKIRYVFGALRNASRAPPNMTIAAFDVNPSLLIASHGSCDCDKSVFIFSADESEQPQLKISSRNIGNNMLMLRVNTLDRMLGNRVRHFEWFVMPFVRAPKLCRWNKRNGLIIKVVGNVGNKGDSFSP